MEKLAQQNVRHIELFFDPQTHQTSPNTPSILIATICFS
jgi:adenosine deaminase